MIENDLAFIDNCPHKVVNQPLKFSKVDTNYVAPLYFKSSGGQLLSEENMYEGPSYPSILFSYNEQKDKIIVAEENYVVGTNYFLTSTATKDTCPICARSFFSGKDNQIFDLKISRDFLLSNKLSLAFQRYYKLLCSLPGSNIFDSTYGTQYRELIGEPMDGTLFMFLSQAVATPVNWYNTKNSSVDLGSDSFIAVINDIVPNVLSANDLQLTLKGTTNTSKSLDIELLGESNG